MKKNWINDLKRSNPDVIDRSQYLRLDKNERIINFNQKFQRYLKRKINSYSVSAYPDLNKVYKLLSNDLKISKKNICLTAGSDFALRMCFEYFTKEKNRIVTLFPTFGMVDVYSKLFNLKNIKIGYNKNLILDFNKLFKNLKKGVAMVIIANPNSPTGTVVSDRLLYKIISKTNKLKIPIIIDEAYYGFYKKSVIHLVKKFNNLVLIRTFSKVFGLAGLRAGFIVTQSRYSKNLFKFKPMYEINTISSIAIEFLLKNKKNTNDHANHIIKTKNYLIKELKALNYKFINTHGNFFHIDLGEKKNKFEKILKKNKILVRKGPGVKGFETYLRFSLGSKLQMKKIISLLKKNKIK